MTVGCSATESDPEETNRDAKREMSIKRQNILRAGAIRPNEPVYRGTLNMHAVMDIEPTKLKPLTWRMSDDTVQTGSTPVAEPAAKPVTPAIAAPAAVHGQGRRDAAGRRERLQP